MINALYSTIIGTSTDSETPKTRTHNLHSEILLGLSLGTNITDSIRRHGIANDSKRVLVVRIGGSQSAEEVREGMKALVDGDITNLGEWDEGTGIDWGRVDKVRSCSSCLCSVISNLMAGVQNGRNESAQGPRTTSKEGSGSRNSSSHQIRNITSESMSYIAIGIVIYCMHIRSKQQSITTQTFYLVSQQPPDS